VSLAYHGDQHIPATGGGALLADQRDNRGDACGRGNELRPLDHGTPRRLNAARSGLLQAPVKTTGRLACRRMKMLGRRVGNRARSRAIEAVRARSCSRTIRVSSRATGAPMQRWSPRPNARWGAGPRSSDGTGRSSDTSGDGRFAAAHMSKTRLLAGIAVPPSDVSRGVHRLPPSVTPNEQHRDHSPRREPDYEHSHVVGRMMTSNQSPRRRKFTRLGSPSSSWIFRPRRPGSPRQRTPRGPRTTCHPSLLREVSRLVGVPVHRGAVWPRAGRRRFIRHHSSVRR